ncbi:MAG: DUF4143 domain-containing protein [Microbacteriaceae bacterium]|nr:DUF4143 domain-containing protein [Microbacteriaceae bacterium]
MNKGNYEYRERVFDAVLDYYLTTFGAVLIEGPKACGKTATAMQHAASVVRLDRDPNARELAAKLPEHLLAGDTPRLIDEWQVEPGIWNAARHLVDDRFPAKGQFIFTGSSVPNDDVNRHSGAGRIAVLQMRPMSLYESGVSSGEVSLAALLQGEITPTAAPEFSLTDVIEQIVRGGWPGNLHLSTQKAQLALSAYVDNIAQVDISSLGDGVVRDPERVRRVLSSLARNVATEASDAAIAADAGGSEGPLDPRTVDEYVQALERIRIVENLPAWSTHLRSSATLRKSPKRFFIDPALATAALGASPKKLLNDLNFVGLLFEALAVRDLRVYAMPLQGRLYHYRDSNGLEVDAVLELRDGTWAAFEVKLGGEAAIEAAAKSLKKFASVVNTDKVGEPAALVVLTALGSVAYRRDDGVCVAPIATLGV